MVLHHISALQFENSWTCTLPDVDRSRRTYCVAPTLTWLKSSWFSSLGTFKNSSLCHASKWHSNSSTASWRWLSDNPNTPGFLERVRQSMTRRAQCCVKAHGGHLEHFLQNGGEEKSAPIRKGGFSGPMWYELFSWLWYVEISLKLWPHL
jgi:hypothetical protein